MLSYLLLAAAAVVIVLMLRKVRSQPPSYTSSFPRGGGALHDTPPVPAAHDGRAGGE